MMTATYFTEQGQLSQSPCVQTPVQSTPRNNSQIESRHPSYGGGGGGRGAGLQSTMQRGIWEKEKEFPPGGSGRVCFVSRDLKARRIAREVNVEDTEGGEDYVSEAGGGDE